MQNYASIGYAVRLVLLMSFLQFTSCKDSSKIDTGSDTANPTQLWIPYDESNDLSASAKHEIERMRYKLIQSKVLDKNAVFEPLYHEVLKMTEEEYQRLKPLILEQDIPTIQNHIAQGIFNYETLTRFFLYRVYQYELNKETTLNAIIALNPNVIEEAKNRDRDAKSQTHHPIYGMPVLLKDNIGTTEMKTTAGAIALMENETDDAFVVSRLKEKGALILGKVNLSEWAYFFCSGCPVGYSALGGQTLNPYGRGIFETGGSSSGSGVAIAANYAVAAVGTETSGSILSPSGQNSIVGLKPTVGLLSRTGIVPISSTLDTPGPMTKNVIDNGILLDAMRGFDEFDEESVQADWKEFWYRPEAKVNLKGKRFGVFKDLVENEPVYKHALDKIEESGGILVVLDVPKPSMEGFISILNIDMRNDLPNYIQTQVRNRDAVKFNSIAELVTFNRQDSLIRMPYGQALFEGILADGTTETELKEIKRILQSSTRDFFASFFDNHNLDAVLSVNNKHASYAAAAKYPALTVPMGFKTSGEPVNLTIIAKQYQEGKLYDVGTAFEKVTQARKSPQGYE